MQILKSLFTFGLRGREAEIGAKKKEPRSAKDPLDRWRAGNRERRRSSPSEPQRVVERRSRGRPRNPLLTPQPCAEAFQVVASGIAAIAKEKSLWQAAKERVRAEADRDPALAPCSHKVLNFLLDKINRDKGYDWHGNESIAADRNMHRRTVQKCHKQLAERGYSLRGSVSGRWRTTLPCLIDAAEEIRQERASKSVGNTTKKSQGMRPRIRNNTPIYSRSDAQKIQEPHAHSGTLTSKDSNLENNPLSQPTSSGRSGGVDQINSILQKIESENREPVIRLLIKPLLQQRRFDAPDNAYTLGVIADKAADLSDDVLKDVLKRLLTERRSVVKASDLEAALKTAQGAATLARQQEIVIRRGDVSWQDWLDDIRARGRPDLAPVIEKLDAMLAPAEWPRPGLPLPTPHEEPESDRREREARQREVAARKQQRKAPETLNNQTSPSCKTAQRMLKDAEIDARAEE